MNTTTLLIAAFVADGRTNVLTAEITEKHQAFFHLDSTGPEMDFIHLHSNGPVDYVEAERLSLSAIALAWSFAQLSTLDQIIYVLTYGLAVDDDINTAARLLVNTGAHVACPERVMEASPYAH